MEITKSDIIKLIEEKRTDNFSTHLVTIFKRDFRPAGEVRNYEIRVWRQHGWNRTFYPIFKFDFNKEEKLVNISDRLNPAGKVFFAFLCVLFSIPWLYWVFEDFDFLTHWIQVLGWIVFMAILFFIAFKAYQVEKEIQLDQIYEIVDMEVNKTPEKEWSSAKIITRLVMYPLSIFLVIVNILVIIPRGGYLVAIVFFGLIGAYLYSDLKILARGKRK